jgi:nucleoside phosphorylase
MSLDDPKHVLANAAERGWRRVLVITALSLEMTAVRKYTSHIASCQGRDGNVFEMGHFRGSGSDWLVVVGESGAGNHLSQSIVTNACIEFGPFELILFVGVAASRKPDDAPIGSVVVSDHIYFPYGGKFKGGQFQARPREFPINGQLLGLARKVVRDEKWHERLSPPYGGVNPQDDLYPKPFPPPARVAPIVSVEAVSADVDSTLEKQITDSYQDSTALEMEGYGAMFAAFSEETACIIVRGISDDRAGKDPKLDKVHQPIAAAHGAAFAYELLDFWGHAKRPPEGLRIVSPPVSAPAASPTTGPTPPANGKGEVAYDSDKTPHEARGKLTVVLSFSDDATDFPEETQRQILDAVRAITGNSAIKIVGSEAGSFHLFLDVDQEDVKRLQSPELREALSQNLKVDLIGIENRHDFEASRADRTKLFNASQAVLNWPRILPDGTTIERPELSQLLQIESDDEGRTKAVIGDPGSGKTALLAALADELKGSKIPFLAIKADILDTNISTEQDLQNDLGLSELPSSMIERLSLRGPVFLIIDQLDALAGYVDLRTGRLSVLLNLVRALGNKRNVHIILSARRFEYEHDTRLKTVRAESVLLELPPWSSMLKILEANGIQAGGWPADAQNVMRSPQSLATLLRLTEASKSEPFDKYQKMLERLWSERILSRPNGHRISRFAGRLAEEMANKETLWLARSRYDSDIEDLQALTAENILTNPAGSPGSVGFSHQTIFEFALARSFAQEEGRLSAYVQQRVTSLFIRPKLWAALTYLRAVEPAAYETELREIWNTLNLRLHLRHLIIDFLGQQSAPISAEIEILTAAMKSSDRHAALQAIFGSSGWFSYFKRTEIAKAMESEAEAGIASVILSRASEFAPSEVVALLEKHWLPDPNFDGNAWNVLQETARWTETHLAAASTIVDRTNISGWAFDHMVSTVGAEQPSVAIRLVLARLNAMLRQAEVEAEAQKIARDEQEADQSALSIYTSPAHVIEGFMERSEGWDSLEALAKADPATYLAIIWPWFRNALETIKRYKDEYNNELSYPLPYSLDFRFGGESTLGLPEPSLLSGLREAAESLAATAPDAFLTWFESVQDEAATPAQRLLAHALSTQPERFAAKALNFLLGDTRRFNLGNIEDHSGTTKRLIESVSPFWSAEQITQFVTALKAFAPRPAEDRDAKSRQILYRYTERIRYELASSLPQERLPPDADAMVKQGERKFGDAKRGAVFSGPTWVGPSMSVEAIGKAADEDILNAFQKLPDATGWDNPNTWMKGGNVQLSRSFADFAKQNPNRAIEIIRQFTADIGARAAGYAIEAMAETVEAGVLLPLIQDLEKLKFASQEYREGVARAIEKLIDRKMKIDDATLGIIEGWLESKTDATSQSDPDEGGEPEIDESKKEEDKRTESLLWGLGGHSIVPGGNFPILETITRTYLQRKDYDRLLNLLQSHLQRSEDEKVWRALMRLFPFIQTEDKPALANFYKALFSKYPSLSTSHEAVIVLAQVHWVVSDFVHEVLDEWEKSSIQFVQQAYGELAALIWLMRPELDWPCKLINDILESEPYSPKRTGAAFAAIHVWTEMPEKKSAPSLIRDLAKNASESTWTAIIDIFRLVDEIAPDPDWILILQAVADEIPKQTSFMSSFVIERLQTLLPHEAELVVKIAKALVEKWSSNIGDIRTFHASFASEIVDIAITLHRLSSRTREAGLELFEQLLTINAYTARDTLDQIDNRFRSSVPTSRPRLARRSANGRHGRRRRVA